MNELIDGREHPLAADLLKYLETMPYHNDRVKLRKRTVQMLALHIEHGTGYDRYLPYQLKVWRDGCLNRCKLGLMTEPLALYWGDFRKILETDMPPWKAEPVLMEPEGEQIPRKWAIPEPIVPKVVRMTLSKGLRKRLLMLRTADVVVREGDDLAEAIWWHYWEQVGERMKNRLPISGRGRSLLARFVALQDKLQKAGALSDQQKTLWLLVEEYKPD